MSLLDELLRTPDSLVFLLDVRPSRSPIPFCQGLRRPMRSLRAGAQISDQSEDGAVEEHIAVQAQVPRRRVVREGLPQLLTAYCLFHISDLCVE